MALTPHPLTEAEWRIIQSLRSVMAQSANFKLTIYGQGSMTRRILDVEPAPRIRIMCTEEVPLAIDD